MHANLKPSKILVNAFKPNNLYVIDFSKCHVLNEDFRNETTIIFQDRDKRRPVFQRNPTIFSGANIQSGAFPTIGDDYESLAYMLLYFLKGGKWFLKDIENYEQKTYENKMRALTLHKLTTPMEKECEGLPSLYFILNNKI